MKTITQYLIATVVLVALVAPPLHSQNTQAQLNQLTVDVLNLTNSVKQLQGTVDQKNSELTNLLQQVLSRFAAIDEGFHRVDAAIAGIKNDNQKNTQSLQDLTNNVSTLKTEFGETKKELQQELVTLQGQVRGLKDQVADMHTTESPLPTAAEIYNDAYLNYSQGFYDLAVIGFREFLRNFPRDIRSQQAQVNIGESLFAQKKFDQALLEYEMAFQNYPEGDRKCVALYKKGLTLVELKQNPDATTAFNTVVKDCAGTPEASNAADALKRAPKR